VRGGEAIKIHRKVKLASFHYPNLKGAWDYLASQCLKVTRFGKVTIQFTPNPNIQDASAHIARHCPKVTRF